MRADDTETQAAPGTGDIMQDLLLRTGRTVKDVYTEHAGTIYRVAYTYMKNRYDAEDAVQEAFLRLIRARPTLADARHERAWLIRTVSNVCRDQLRSKARQHEDLDDHAELAAPEQGDSALLAAVLALPEKYRIVLYLYGVEGYSVREIAALLRRPPNTVKTRLSRAREMLRTEWEV